MGESQNKNSFFQFTLMLFKAITHALWNLISYFLETAERSFKNSMVVLDGLSAKWLRHQCCQLCKFFKICQIPKFKTQSWNFDIQKWGYFQSFGNLNILDNSVEISAFFCSHILREIKDVEFLHSVKTAISTLLSGSGIRFSWIFSPLEDWNSPN